MRFASRWSSSPRLTERISLQLVAQTLSTRLVRLSLSRPDFHTLERTQTLKCASRADDHDEKLAQEIDLAARARTRALQDKATIWPLSEIAATQRNCVPVGRKSDKSRRPRASCATSARNSESRLCQAHSRQLPAYEDDEQK